MNNQTIQLIDKLRTKREINFSNNHSGDNSQINANAAVEYLMKGPTQHVEKLSLRIQKV